jgi:hypothetical protein
MSATGSLTKFYGSFFWKLGEFAVCPYVLTLNAFMYTRPKKDDLILGIAACLFFSTVVPILPAITSITFAIAAVGVCFALASMFVSYPFTLIADAVSGIFTGNSLCDEDPIDRMSFC